MAEQSETPTTCVENGDHSNPKAPDVAGLPATPIGGMQIYPALIPNFALNGNQEHSNRGAGLYAVPVLPFAGSSAVPIPNILIPLTYNVPTTTSSSVGEAPAQENEAVGQQGAQPQQQGVPDGQVVVRQFAINLDLALLVKLAAVIYLFHQDGSRQRLALLVFIASIVYLYQTGAFEPLKRWLARSLNRVPQAARPPRDALPADDLNLGNENAAQEERALDDGRGNEAENRNPADNGPAEDVAAGQHNANHNPLWVLMKEIQIIVLGFITSLLPGFQHLD